MISPIMELATGEAAKLTRRWKAAQFEDIFQEILLWTVEIGLDDSDIDLATNQLDEDAFQSFTKEVKRGMSRAGERYCRKERAAVAGYAPEDEAFYSVKQLKELLPIYYQVGVEETPPRGTADSVRRSAPGGSHESGTWVATMLDIERSLTHIRPIYQVRLSARFGPLAELTDDRIANLAQSEIKDLLGWHHERLREVFGEGGRNVSSRVETALRALQRALGGVNPWNRGPTPRRHLEPSEARSGLPA